MNKTPIKELEVAELQNQTGSSLINLHDLRVLFYQAQTGLTTTNEHDLIKAFLQAETTLVIDSLSDLWRAYMLSRGVTDYESLSDMFREFYTSIGFGGGYAETREVAIQHAKVSGSSSLSNYELLFAGTYSYLATEANGGKLKNANGFDFIFSTDTAGSNTLSYEVVSHNLTTGAVEIWIKVPSVSHNTNTPIYIHYGNAEITTSQADPTNSNAGAFLITHMDNLTTTTLKDSTSNNHVLTKTAVGEPLEATGKIGQAQHFDGSNDAVTSPDASTLEPTAITISAWVNLDALPSSGQFANIVRKYASAGYFLRVNSAGIGQFAINNGTLKFVLTTSAITTGTWAQLVGTYSTDGDVAIYFNGTSEASGIQGSGSMTHDSDPLNIGLRGADKTDGLIDEVRLYPSKLSADLIKTMYENQSDPSTFYVISAVL